MLDLGTLGDPAAASRSGADATGRRTILPLAKLAKVQTGIFRRMAHGRPAISASLMDKIDYLSGHEQPGRTLRNGGAATASATGTCARSRRAPFRLVPYFAPEVWGGQWMKDDLRTWTSSAPNYAWAFDGVPEENSIYMSLRRRARRGALRRRGVLLPAGRCSANGYTRGFGDEYPDPL